jgi:hypothetical protein
MLSNDTGNTSFLLAADFINKSNHPVFLTGKAGTGKTTFLKFIKENTTKNTAVVAPTGVAAMNAGGTTIHSFFQLPFTPFIPGRKGFTAAANDTHNLISQLRLNAERKELLQQLDLLIIDEISMVRADVLDAIDLVLRHVRHNQGAPFGGVQLLYIGDMYQLPPVVKSDEWSLLSNSYTDPFFFSSQVIAEQPPVYIELNKVYRQRDEDFIKLLNQVRNNEMDQQGYDLLHSRYRPVMVTDPGERVITLTTHNAKADAINGQALAAIPEKVWRFPAAIEGSFYESAFPADELLQLKVGAQVMFIKNDMEKVRRYYNGKIGIVYKVEDDNIWVECDGDARQLIELKKETWRNIKYTLNKKTDRVEEEELGSFTQFPLRLAWAITIHKSQGLTFEKAIIDAGNAFSPGQVYVALSRCRSLNGLSLVSKIAYDSLKSDPRIVSFAKNQRSLADQSILLKNATWQYEQEVVRSVFDFDEPDKDLVAFKNWVTEPLHFKQSLDGWLNNLQEQWGRLIVPGRKFLQQLMRIGEETTGTGNVDYLKKRVSAAAIYFLQELKKMDSLMHQSPAITDNRQLAKDYSQKLQNLYDVICRKIHFIEACKDGFSIDSYQQQKLSFSKTLLPDTVYSGRSAAFVPKDVLHPGLYTLLKAKRDALCEQLNLPVYMVCSTASVEQLANALPMSLHALGNISGFGKVKLKQFGKDFITIISEYCSEHALESNPGAVAEKKVRKPKAESAKPDTKLLTFDLFKFGKTVREIAEARNLTVSTIETHLSHYITDGKIKIGDVIDAQKIKQISDAREAAGSDAITTLKSKLPDISYGELSMFLASLKFQALQD